jgi:hypothetical protein
MGLSLATFEAAPSGAMVPTSRELQAFSAWNAQSTQADRTRLMNEICGLLGVPQGGWTSPQSRLFDRGDVRLVWLLRRLAKRRSAENTVQNLQRTTRFVDAEVMLTLVTAARENAGSVGAVTIQPIDTWSEGGLDFLWEERDRLGLPKSITSQWRQVAPFRSPETGSIVHPAEIPARDQVLAYAAQMNASFRNSLNRYRQWLNSQPSPSTVPSDGCRVATLIWKAYAFLAPGGLEFSSNQSFDSQLGQRFGCFTALTYLSKSPSSDPAARHFDRIISEAQLNRVEWVRIAKVRVAEALYLERLLITARTFLTDGL